VTAPTRTRPGFAPAEIVTVPGPLGFGGAEIDNQDEPEAAVQLQAPTVVTVTEALPPSREIVIVRGDTVKLHAIGAWLTRSALSFTFRLPCRVTGSGLGAIVNASVAVPCPDEAPGLIQLTSEATVHVHSGCADTWAVAVPPLASIVDGAASNVTPHFAGDGAVEVVKLLEVHPTARPIEAVSAKTLSSRPVG